MFDAPNNCSPRGSASKKPATAVKSRPKQKKEEESDAYDQESAGDKGNTEMAKATGTMQKGENTEAAMSAPKDAEVLTPTPTIPRDGSLAEEGPSPTSSQAPTLVLGQEVPEKKRQDGVVIFA